MDKLNAFVVIYIIHCLWISLKTKLLCNLILYSLFFVLALWCITQTWKFIRLTEIVSFCLAWNDKIVKAFCALLWWCLSFSHFFLPLGLRELKYIFYLFSAKNFFLLSRIGVWLRLFLHNVVVHYLIVIIFDIMRHVVWLHLKEVVIGLCTMYLTCERHKKTFIILKIYSLSIYFIYC